MQPMASPKVVVPKQSIVLNLKNTSGAEGESSASASSQPLTNAVQAGAASKKNTPKKKCASVKKKYDATVKEPYDHSSASTGDDSGTSNTSGQLSDSQDHKMADAERISWKLPEV